MVNHQLTAHSTWFELGAEPQDQTMCVQILGTGGPQYLNCASLWGRGPEGRTFSPGWSAEARRPGKLFTEGEFPLPESCGGVWLPDQRSAVTMRRGKWSVYYNFIFGVWTDFQANFIQISNNCYHFHVFTFEFAVDCVCDPILSPWNLFSNQISSPHFNSGDRTFAIIPILVTANPNICEIYQIFIDIIGFYVSAILI